MAPPVIKVEIGVPPTASTGASWWVLGDATRGHTDGSYLIGPEYDYLDMTSQCQSFTIDRSRDREFDTPNAGTASAVFRDDRPGNNRKLDPLNTSSIFYPNLLARSKLRITVDSVVLFTGDITTLDRDEASEGSGSQDRTTTVSIAAADIFSRLATTQVTYLPEKVHNSQERMLRILEEAMCGAGTFLEVGAYNYQADTQQQGSALDLLSEIAFAERGMLWCTTTEGIAFLLNSTLTAASAAITVDDGQSGASYQYSDVSMDNGNELLINDITIDSIAGDPFPVHQQNHTSIGKYGLRSWPGGTVKSPVDSKTDRRAVAAAIVASYGDPVTRFRTFTIPTARYSSRSTILNLDYGDKVTVKRNPIGSGSPTTITQDLYVIGVHHEGKPRWVESTFTLGPIT